MKYENKRHKTVLGTADTVRVIGHNTWGGDTKLPGRRI